MAGRLVPLLAFAAFLPALINGFVRWDDYTFIVANPRLLDLGWMLTTTEAGLYQPLSWLSLALDRLVWGLDPFGFHLTSLLLHALNAGLVFLLGRRLLKRDDAALTAALLFAVHPLRTEAVVWAATRKDVLATAFNLLTTLLYLDRREKPALACFAAGLLAKGSGVGLPLVLWLLDRRRKPWSFAALALVFGAAGAVFGQRWSQGYGLLERLGLAAYGGAFYLRKTLWPSDLSPMYEIPVPFSDLRPMALASAGLLAGLAAAAWRWKELRVPLLSYAALVAPALGLVQFGRHLAADRYSYLACIPLALAAGRFRALLLAVPVLFALSWRQAGFWRDSETLWARAAAAWPRSAVTQMNLAAALAERGRLEEALVRSRAAARMDPGYLPARENLAAVLARLGKFEEAAPLLEHKPAVLARVRFNWGNALLRQGRRKEARAQYEEAARLDPSFEPARRALTAGSSRRRAR